MPTVRSILPSRVGVICCLLSDNAESGLMCTSIIAPSNSNSLPFCSSGSIFFLSPPMWLGSISIGMFG